MRCFLLLPITSHGPKNPIPSSPGALSNFTAGLTGGTDLAGLCWKKSIFADGRWTPRPGATLEPPSKAIKAWTSLLRRYSDWLHCPWNKTAQRSCLSCSWSTFTSHRQTHVSETKLGASGLDVLVGLVRPSLLHPLRAHTHMSAGGLAGLPRRRLHSSSAYLLLVEEDVGRVLPLLADVRAARLADLGVVEGEPAVRRVARFVARVNAVADVVAWPARGRRLTVTVTLGLGKVSCTEISSCPCRSSSLSL